MKRLFPLACLALLPSILFAAPPVATTDYYISTQQSSGVVYVIVRLDPAAATTTSVSWSASDGTAKWGDDFDTKDGLVTFNVGEATKIFPIGLTTSPAITAAKTFTVFLNAGTGYDLGAQTSATVSIEPKAAAIPSPTPRVPPPTLRIDTKVVRGRVFIIATATDAFGQTVRKREVVRLKTQ
jgi:hypothetical protein